MVRDAAATRTRILDAAVHEFSRLGLSGARIDRIAELSGSNKRMIYVYFTDKEGLFAATLEKVVGDLVTEVPITEDDLPAYAGALFDYLLVHPDALRLTMWRQLERPEAGPEAAAVYTEKVAALHRSTSLMAPGRTIPPTDLLVLVQGMAGAWLISPPDLLTADGSDPSDPARIATHRAALVEAVRLLTHDPSDDGDPR
ncbi:MAG: TetR family transcriptional regulator [Nocardioides sp.]